MSNKPMPWIKQYPTRLHDVRLAALNDRQQLRFYQLYLLAGQLNADGAFIQDGKELSVIDIGFLLRVSDCKQLEKDLNALKKSKLLRFNGHGPFIADFKDEQLNWLEKQREDRERQQRKRESDASREGHITVTRDSRNGHAPRTRIQNQTKTQIKIKNQTTHPYPPAKGGGSPLGGGGGGNNNKSKPLDNLEFKKLNQKQRTELTRIQNVLILSGLGFQKLENLLHILATRSSIKNKMQTVLAALASVYADKSVNNKPIVAALRIDADHIPAEYFSPSMWNVIPESILAIVGDIKQYGIVIKQTPAQEMIDDLRKRSRKSGNIRCTHQDVIGKRDDGTDRLSKICGAKVVGNTFRCKKHQEMDT